MLFRLIKGGRGADSVEKVEDTGEGLGLGPGLGRMEEVGVEGAESCSVTVTHGCGCSSALGVSCGAMTLSGRNNSSLMMVGNLLTSTMSTWISIGCSCFSSASSAVTGEDGDTDVEGDTVTLGAIVVGDDDWKGRLFVGGADRGDGRRLECWDDVDLWLRIESAFRLYEEAEDFRGARGRVGSCTVTAGDVTVTVGVVVCVVVCEDGLVVLVFLGYGTTMGRCCSLAFCGS